MLIRYFELNRHFSSLNRTLANSRKRTNSTELLNDPLFYQKMDEAKDAVEILRYINRKLNIA